MERDVLAWIAIGSSIGIVYTLLNDDYYRKTIIGTAFIGIVGAITGGLLVSLFDNVPILAPQVRLLSYIMAVDMALAAIISLGYYFE